MTDLDQREREHSAAIAQIWRELADKPAKPGWPTDGPGPLLPTRLRDHLSHYRTPDGIIYRAEPYGPLKMIDLLHIASLGLAGWDVELDPRGSTHYPGSTINLLIWRVTP